MTAIALGVDRTAGYPRAVVEPLLWLASSTGLVWLVVALDARSASSSVGGATIEPGLTALAAALALVLLLNGLAALTLSGQGGSIARGLAAVSGVGLGVSGWAFSLIPELPPQARYWLLVGSIVCGVSLAVLAQLHWRNVVRAPGEVERGTAELVLISGLALVAGLVAYRAYGAIDLGLVGVGNADESGWSVFLPAAQALAAILATMGQLWNRRWMAASVTMAIGAALTVGAIIVTA
jgi:hypothetical protein